MKFAAVILLAFVAAAVAGPTSISENNVGDIVNVKVDASLDISNKVDQTIVNVLAAYLNRQSIGIGGGNGDDSDDDRRINRELLRRIIEWVRSREGDDDSQGIRDRIRDRIGGIDSETIDRIREWLSNRN
jgi:hypothetical protein